MPLQDYSVTRDKFELAETVKLGLCFPCRCCKHQDKTDRDEPCRTCDHNCNAQPDAPNAPHERRREE